MSSTAAFFELHLILLRILCQSLFVSFLTEITVYNQKSFLFADNLSFFYRRFAQEK